MEVPDGYRLATPEERKTDPCPLPHKFLSGGRWFTGLTPEGWLTDIDIAVLIDSKVQALENKRLMNYSL
jgi:hypothetical protein